MGFVAATDTSTSSIQGHVLNLDEGEGGLGGGGYFALEGVISFRDFSPGVGGSG